MNVTMIFVCAMDALGLRCQKSDRQARAVNHSRDIS